MKRFLAVLCMLLCLLMAISCFVGCGGKQTIVESEIWEDEDPDASEENNSEETDETDENESKDDPKSSGTASKKPEQGSMNLKGAKVIVACWGSGAGPKTSSGTYKKELELVSTIEKRYNCKLEWKAVEDPIIYYRNFTTAAMAGTKFADIAKFPGDQSFPNAIAGGYVWQLDSFMTGFDDVTMWADVVDNALKVNGKHFFLAPAGALHNYSALFFNQDVFDKCSVSKTPHDYMKEGNWNWNTFLEVAKACTKNVGGVQYYGYHGTSPRLFIRSNGGQVWKTNADGSQSFNYDDPICIETIQFMYDLYNVHKVVPVSNGTPLFESGQVAMKTCTSSEYRYTDFKYAEVPIGPRVKDYVDNCADCHLWAIPKAVKEANVPVMLAILKDYINPTYKWRQTLEELAETWYNDDESISYIISHIKRFDIATNKYWNTYYPWCFQNIYTTDFGISKQQSPSAFIQSKKAAGVAEIDTTWKQVKDRTK